MFLSHLRLEAGGGPPEGVGGHEAGFAIIRMEFPRIPVLPLPASKKEEDGPCMARRWPRPSSHFHSNPLAQSQLTASPSFRGHWEGESVVGQLFPGHTWGVPLLKEKRGTHPGDRAVFAVPPSLSPAILSRSPGEPVTCTLGSLSTCLLARPASDSAPFLLTLPASPCPLAPSEPSHVSLTSLPGAV